jgi:pimeloyl-ACP methyl ester carboxylesterase
VIFVHGVGLAPSLFEATAHSLTRRSRVHTRAGYDGTPLPASFAEQVDALIGACDADGPCVLVGVSGGATLALAVAVAAPQSVVAAVTHEPLVGPLEPELDALVQGAAERLALDPSHAPDFLRSLYGADVWALLPSAARTWTADRLDVVAADVAQFAGFAPSPSDLESVRCPHLTTVGETSAPSRHRVASMLEGCGAERRVIAGAGHLVVAEQPRCFAETIDEFVTAMAVA